MRVVTIAGVVSSQTLGLTPRHEHLSVDASAAIKADVETEADSLRDRPVRIEDVALLRDIPYSSLHNCLLDDGAVARSELAHFVARGGTTVVDVSCWGIGRDRARPLAVARATSLNVVVMVPGCTWNGRI